MATFVSNDYFIAKDNKSNDEETKDHNLNMKPIQIPELKVSGLSNSNFQKSPKSPVFSSSVFKNLPVRPIDYQDLPKFKHNIIIDIRSFNHYIVSRVKNSINICLPSTLLKRPSYHLPQVLNSIKIDDSLKELLLNPNNVVDIVFYDDNSFENQISFQLYQTILKFLNFNKNYKVYYLNYGFNMSKIDPTLIDHQLSPISPINDGNSNDNHSSSPDKNNSSSKLNHGKNFKNNHNLPCLLSGFQLPSSTSSSQKFLSSMKSVPKLNIESIHKDLYNYKYNFKFLNNENFSHGKLISLPIWLKQIFLKDDKLNSTNEILKILNIKFNKIEYNEQIRIKLAINGQLTYNCNCTPSTPCPSCDGINYKIPKGIEYGLKNRYKNIFPFEHSRVKLINEDTNENEFNHQQLHHHHHYHSQQTSEGQTDNETDDYFNGNFIEFNKISNSKYIATQNPLSSTFYDFWNMVWYNTNLIICLNNQNDFNIKYFDNQTLDNIKIELQSLQPHENFNLRILKLFKYNESKLVYHLEYKDWPDFGVPDINSILNFIDFKNDLIKNFKLNSSSLVHCSAGCGRTGSFITIDMVLDLFKNFKLNGDNKNEKFNPYDEIDLIYKSIQFQRSQRVSMVQNFDQYLVCYDTIINYLMNND